MAEPTSETDRVNRRRFHRRATVLVGLPLLGGPMLTAYASRNDAAGGMKQAMDICTSVPAQQTVTDFLAVNTCSLTQVACAAFIVSARRRCARPDAAASASPPIPSADFCLWVTFADKRIDTQADRDHPDRGCGLHSRPHVLHQRPLPRRTEPVFRDLYPERIDEAVARFERAVDTIGATR